MRCIVARARPSLDWRSDACDASSAAFISRRIFSFSCCARKRSTAHLSWRAVLSRRSRRFSSSAAAVTFSSMSFISCSRRLFSSCATTSCTPRSSSVATLERRRLSCSAAAVSAISLCRWSIAAISVSSAFVFACAFCASFSISPLPASNAASISRRMSSFSCCARTRSTAYLSWSAMLSRRSLDFSVSAASVTFSSMSLISRSSRLFSSCAAASSIAPASLAVMLERRIRSCSTSAAATASLCRRSNDAISVSSSSVLACACTSSTPCLFDSSIDSRRTRSSRSRSIVCCRCTISSIFVCMSVASPRARWS